MIVCLKGLALHKGYLKFDIAIILVFLPSIFQFKLPLFIYVIFAFSLLIFKVKFNRIFLTVFAFFGIILVWYLYILQYQGKFMDINVVLTFLGMIFLVLTITFRLNGRINAYLILSTFLVLVFSLHYYETSYIIIYSILCLYGFLILYLWDRQQSTFKEAMLYANKMMLLATPFIVILFLLFPRFDFTSFHTSKIKNSRTATGFDGKLSLRDAGAIIPSSKKAFEVIFENEVPNESHLYFRGSVLYANQYGHWETKLHRSGEWEEKILEEIKPIRYKINIFPHGKKWLYSLDYLSKVLSESHRYKDGTLLAKENINETYRYNLISEISPKYDFIEKNSTKNNIISPHIAPRLYEETRDISTIENEEKRLLALISYLSSKKLSYNLDVKRLKSLRPIDEFLFKSKEGYCVHFSILFATATQYINLPSRVVTGYLTTKKEQIENYIFVTGKNAHAWTEVYIKNKGWVRFEATKLATGNVELYPQKQGFLGKAEDLSLYSKFLLYNFQEFLVEIAYLLELDFLEEKIEETGILLQIFMLLFFVSILVYLLINTFTIKQKTHEKELQSLLKSLEKQGFKKLKGETIESFLKRVSQQKEGETCKTVLEINEAYLNWVYGEKKEAKYIFKQKKKMLFKNWK